MDLSYLFIGYYTIWLKTQDYKRFFHICTFHGLSFTNLEMNERTNRKITECRFRIRCDQMAHIIDAAQKTDSEYQIIATHGLPFLFSKIRQHIFFFFGAAMALFLLICLSKRVWDISYVGNCYYGDEKLNRFFKEQQIQCGMNIGKINCMEISEKIRAYFPRITWASASIDGCRLVVHVKENVIIEKNSSEESKTGVYNYISDQDGIVYDILVRNGISQVEIGQSVKKGEVLISGYIPIKNHAGEIVSYEATTADGDVLLMCEYSYYKEIDRIWYEDISVKEQTMPIIQIGEMRFDIFDWLPNASFKYKDLSVDHIGIEKNIRITNAFSLPISVGIHKQRYYKKTERTYTDSELEQIATSYFHEFCINLEKKGVQIYENNVKMNISDVSCVISGKLTTIERTGSLQSAKELMK